jgi:dienelactone hydrolase
MATILLIAVLISQQVAESAPTHSDHQDLSYYLDGHGTRVPSRTVADWQHRREHILAGMQEVMGALPHPANAVPLEMRVIEEHRDEGYIRRKIAYHTDDSQSVVKAWLLLPMEKSGESLVRGPAMLCLHQTTSHGKNSPVGLSDRSTMHFAAELARRGFVTLSPDYPSFGEYPYEFKDGRYRSGSMKAIYDNIRAIDVLESLPEVDPERIGCIGHSLGGHNALFTAVFDERIKAVVTSCGFTAFHKYKGGDLHGWSSPRYMPLIGTKYDYSPAQMPFDFAEVLAAIAPRAVFVNAPLRDDNFDIDGVKECLAAATPIFKLLGGADHLQAVHPDGSHDFSDAEREQAYRFLNSVLCKRDTRGGR